MKAPSGSAAAGPLSRRFGALALALGVAATLAAGPRPARAPAGPAAFTSLTCFGTSFCMAAGGDAEPGHRPVPLLEKWNGRTWRVIADPRGYRLSYPLTCGGPSFCLATIKNAKSPPRTVQWNGRTWQNFTPQPPDPLSITCYPHSPTFCRSGDLSLTGKSWQNVPDASPICGGPDCGYGVVSCISADFCTGVASFCTDDDCDSQATWYAIWNGSYWINYSDSQPSFPGFCAGRGFCLTIGSPAHAEVTNNWATTWHDVTANLAAVCQGIARCTQPAYLDCGSPQSCVAIPTAGAATAVTWNGATWKATPIARLDGHLPKLTLLSCGNPGDCVAVGTIQLNLRSNPRPIAEHWNGTAWHITPMPNP
jgi:hypothetical protein